MKEYYFLFALAFVWTFFAVVQDLKSREVANWLNFSLIAFALAFRAFYSISTSNKDFFLFGLAGFAIFFVLAHALYYSKAFAGGDAKLLMGFGIILPYTSYSSLLTMSLFFFFLLFLTGAVYSMTYSIFLINKNQKEFKKEFNKRIKNGKHWLFLSVILFVASTLYGFINPITFLPALIFLIPIVYIYTKSLDKCMIKLYPPSKLTEGDWLEKNVTVSGKTIKKSVHGLSIEEIKLLRKHNKKVLVKEGIPFTPAFLISLIIMGYAFLVLQFSPSELVAFLF
jgi:Flp pilus assembly protein protease CpaA